MTLINYTRCRTKLCSLSFCWRNWRTNMGPLLFLWSINCMKSISICPRTWRLSLTTSVSRFLRTKKSWANSCLIMFCSFQDRALWRRLIIIASWASRSTSNLSSFAKSCWVTWIILSSSQRSTLKSQTRTAQVLARRCRIQRSEVLLSWGANNKTKKACLTLRLRKFWKA